MRNFLLCALATLGLALGATIVWGVGSAVTLDPSTGKTYPQQISAGYLATADGGVPVNVTAAAPTAAGQGLVTTDPTHMAYANIPVGSGTVNYIPEWTPDGTHLGNSKLWESATALYRQTAGNNSIVLESYTATLQPTEALFFRHSLGTSIGSLVTTTNGSGLGQIGFLGTSTVPVSTYGASISVNQTGTAGSYLPTQMCLTTYTASGPNTNQECLNSDNSVSMSGPVSAANLPYCKDGQVLQGGTSTATGTNTSTVTSRSCQNPSWQPSFGTGSISQVPCVGTNTSITTATGTSTSVSLCTIPISSTTAPSLLQISTATPLANAASGSAGNGLQVSAWNHVHPISSSGLIYYATSGAGFSTTLPVTTTELTQAMAAGSATINLATSSGTPGLSVWPAGTLNYDVWAYMSAMGSGCTYLLNNFQVAAVRGASTAYQTGGGSAGATLTGSYARYQYTVPVSQLTGTSIDIFKTPLIVTSTNSPTCNAATLHIGVGTGQATNIGTLFYQVPSLDGVEYQANKNTANGYCPLDSSSLVPVANLPAVTESVAGAMSAADKMKLDGIASGATVDDHKVAAYAGATPDYLTSVMTSPNTTISLGVDTSNHVTIDVGASVVSSTTTHLLGSVAVWASGSGNTIGNGPPYANYPSLFGPYDNNLVMSNADGYIDAEWDAIGTPYIGMVAQVGTLTSWATASSTSTSTSRTYVRPLLPSTQARIATTTNTATASSTSAKAMPEDAQVILPSGTATAPGIVKLGATGGAQPTITCPQGQILQGGTSNATGTGTATNTTTTQTCQNPSWATSTGTGLGTSTQGAVLYNGSTATGTNSTSSPVWGAPPAALSYGSPSAENFGASGLDGTSTQVARTDHVHSMPSLPFASTSVAGICQFGSGSGTCVQGNDTRFGSSAIRSVSFVTLAADTSNTGGAWTDFLTVNTSGSAGRIVAQAALGLLCNNNPCNCNARIVLDAAAVIGPETIASFAGTWQSLSPIFSTTFASGAHVVKLQVGANGGNICTASVSGSVNRGALIVTEYTN